MITCCAFGTERNRVGMGKCQGGGSEEEQNVQNEGC